MKNHCQQCFGYGCEVCEEDVVNFVRSKKTAAKLSFKDEIRKMNSRKRDKKNGEA